MKITIKPTCDLNNDQISILQRMFTTTNLVRNNLHMMHWYATGPKFNEIHSLCEEYYNKLNEYFDAIAEMNMQHCVSVGHPLIEYYRDEAYMLEVKEYRFDDFIESLYSQFGLLLDTYNSASTLMKDFPGDCSVIDDMIGYISKERDYKLTRRV